MEEQGGNIVDNSVLCVLVDPEHMVKCPFVEGEGGGEELRELV